MLKYYKEFLSDYAYADVIQTLVVIAFWLFFLGLFYVVWKRPKGYYKEVANLPLEDNDKLFD